MGDHKRLFYMNRPDLLSVDIGDVSKRLQFKKDKQCRPFKWYLDTVYPEKYVLDDPGHARAHGRARSPDTGLCFDTLQADEKGKESFRLGAYPCHDFVSSTQYFSLSRKGEIR